MSHILRQPAEVIYQQELAALKAADTLSRPEKWQLSPQAVVTYLLGGAVDDMPITPKYIGSRRLIETAVATLATDRALLLLGVPGTAKSWVSEHLAAAISGDSTGVIQCTAGTDENQVRYGWNYAQLLAHGPSKAAIVPTPLFRAMENGSLCRLEELTRMSSDVQDTLITVLSEKMLPIPELNDALYARAGFNVIATANNKDKGVNELSSALKRRFNVVVLPLPADMEEEIQIVSQRVAETGEKLSLPVPENTLAEIRKVITMFRELRSGATLDGNMALKTPSGNLSAAEAIAVMIGSLSHAHWFNHGKLAPQDISSSLLGAMIKDPVQDKQVLAEYLEMVLKKRKDYQDYYHSLQQQL